MRMERDGGNMGGLDLDCCSFMRAGNCLIRRSSRSHMKSEEGSTNRHCIDEISCKLTLLVKLLGLLCYCIEKKKTFDSFQAVYTEINVLPCP